MEIGVCLVPGCLYCLLKKMKEFRAKRCGFLSCFIQSTWKQDPLPASFAHKMRQNPALTK